MEGELILRQGGALLYRHYAITIHVQKRYIQRFGGTAEDLANDLDSSTLFYPSKKRVRVWKRLNRIYQDGGYALITGDRIFIIKPGDEFHFVITTYPDISDIHYN